MGTRLCPGPECESRASSTVQRPRAPHLYAGADAGSVGAHLIRFATSAEDKREKGEAARSGGPQIDAFTAGDDQRGSVRGVERQGKGGRDAFGAPPPGDGSGARIDDGYARRFNAQQIQQAVAIEIDHSELECPGGRLGGDERRPRPGSGAAAPGKQLPIRGGAVDFRLSIGVRVRDSDRYKRCAAKNRPGRGTAGSATSGRSARYRGAVCHSRPGCQGRDHCRDRPRAPDVPLRHLFPSRPRGGGTNRRGCCSTVRCQQDP